MHWSINTSISQSVGPFFTFLHSRDHCIHPILTKFGINLVLDCNKKYQGKLALKRRQTGISLMGEKKKRKEKHFQNSGYGQGMAKTNNMMSRMRHDILKFSFDINSGKA